MLRWLYRISGAVAVTSFVSEILVGRYFVHTRPHTPDPSTGQIHYYKGVNGVVYLTGGELGLANGLWVAFGVSALLCWVYLIRVERQARKGR